MNAIEQFRGWMERRGFNQAQTAAFFGWHESVISQYLSGLRAPELRNAAVIEERTGIPARAWVLSEDDKSSASTSSATSKRKIHRA